MIQVISKISPQCNQLKDIVIKTQEEYTPKQCCYKTAPRSPDSLPSCQQYLSHFEFPKSYVDIPDLDYLSQTEEETSSQTIIPQKQENMSNSNMIKLEEQENQSTGLGFNLNLLQACRDNQLVHLARQSTLQNNINFQSQQQSQQQQKYQKSYINALDLRQQIQDLNSKIGTCVAVNCSNDSMSTDSFSEKCPQNMRALSLCPELQQIQNQNAFKLKKKISKTKKQLMLEKIDDKNKILTCNWNGVCKYQTLKRRLLLQHQRRQHKASKIFKGSYVCSMCNSSFHIQKALEYHILKIHNQQLMN